MSYIDDEDYKPINWNKRRLRPLPLDEYPGDKYHYLRDKPRRQNPCVLRKVDTQDTQGHFTNG